MRPLLHQADDVILSTADPAMPSTLAQLTGRMIDEPYEPFQVRTGLVDTP
jgi:hypothetical protein